MSGFNLPPGVTTGMIEDQISPEYYLIRRADFAFLARLHLALIAGPPTLDAQTCDQLARKLATVRDNIEENPY